jgi:hypothetical protein
MYKKMLEGYGDVKTPAGYQIEKDNVKLLTCGLSIVYDLNNYRCVLKITHRKIEHDKFLIRSYVNSGVGIKPALATI